MRILTEQLLDMAFNLAKPSILAILNHEGATWGPRWVAVYVAGSGLGKTIDFGFGEKDPSMEWKPEWEHPEKFFSIARKKLVVAKREKAATSVVVATRPWCLEEGEFLYPGGVYRDGVTVAVSGAKGRADEAIAEIILSIILMLAHLETDRRIQEKQMEI